MAKETKIAWTHATFNGWRGCAKISEGCSHCYAEGWAKRTGKAIWGKDAKREHASETYWKQPVKWNEEAAKTGEQFRVFCASLADVCEDREDLLEPRARLMRLIETTPALTWLLCTKRPENFMRMFGNRWNPGGWPKNVWVLTTAENQKQADKRITEILKIPNVVRGVSYEPALELVNFEEYLWPSHWSWDSRYETPEKAKMAGAYAVKKPQCLVSAHCRFLNWVIVGGESGAGARPFNVAWAKNIIDQCHAADTPVFIKQLGRRVFWDGCIVQWHQNPVSNDGSLNGEIGWWARLKDKKGGDMAEWPKELRVREFPRPR